MQRRAVSQGPKLLKYRFLEVNDEGEEDLSMPSHGKRKPIASVNSLLVLCFHTPTAIPMIQTSLSPERRRSDSAQSDSERVIVLPRGRDRGCFQEYVAQDKELQKKQEEAEAEHHVSWYRIIS